MTDQTLKQQSELIRSVQQRSIVLEQEKKEMEQITEQLQQEIHCLKQLIAERENSKVYLVFLFFNYRGLICVVFIKKVIIMKFTWLSVE